MLEEGLGSDFFDCVVNLISLFNIRSVCLSICKDETFRFDTLCAPEKNVKNVIFNILI